MQMPSTMWTRILKVREDPVRVKDLVARRYRQPIHDFAVLQGLPLEDAEDVAQEVFMRVCQESFLRKADRDRGRFRSYLLAVTKHVIASLQRYQLAEKRDRRKEISLDDFEVPESVPDDPDFDQLWAKNLVDKALDRLAEDATIPAYRLKIQGKSYKEIAKELGIRESDVSNAVQRAPKRLKREIEKMILEYSTEAEVPGEIAALRKFL